jgi:hypothetical protein
MSKRVPGTACTVEEFLIIAVSHLKKTVKLAAYISIIKIDRKSVVRERV